MTKTVKLWAWLEDGIERVTVFEGQTTRFSWGGPTEEGYHNETVEFTLEGDVVTMEVTTEARDCDGRLDTWGVYECPVAQIRSDLVDGKRLPAWEKVSSRQRDHSAEAMGY